MAKKIVWVFECGGFIYLKPILGIIAMTKNFRKTGVKNKVLVVVHH